MILIIATSQQQFADYCIAKHLNLTNEREIKYINRPEQLQGYSKETTQVIIVGDARYKRFGSVISVYQYFKKENIKNDTF